MWLIVQEPLVLVTVQFVGAVDNCFTVPMRITNKIYSILLAEKCPCRPGKKAIFLSYFSLLQNEAKYFQQFTDKVVLDSLC